MSHASTTDPQARLYKKAEGEKSQLCYLGHALMENRNGLAVDLETTLASSTVEREVAKAMVERWSNGFGLGSGQELWRGRGVTPHVADE